MKKNILFIIVVIMACVASAQENEIGIQREGQKKTRKTFEEARNERKKRKKRPPITAYKIIDVYNDTTYVDTSLTIQKDYNFNYLRRDDFGLQPIHNVGQSYNSMIKVEERQHLLPLFGARARHFNFMEVEDIKYYNVATPLSEIYFKTTFEQGQQMDAFITVNTSPRLNLSIAYKGVRSLGKFQHALTSTGNFRSAISYHTKNERYAVKTHFVAQDLMNQENGGLSEAGKEQYLATGEYVGDDDKFADRGSVEVNFRDAENELLGKRFYLDHAYALIYKKDSVTDTRLLLGHMMNMTDKKYTFVQTAANALFGASYKAGSQSDKVALEDFTNEAYLQYQHKCLGKVKIIGGYSDYNYGYNSLLVKQNESGESISIPNRIKGNVSFVGAAYKNTFRGFLIDGYGKYIVSGDQEGNYAGFSLGYTTKNKIGLKGGVTIQSVAPNYNFLLYQSDYVGYNWENTFENTDTKKLYLDVMMNAWGDLQASRTSIDKYAYFVKEAGQLTTPMQATETINLLKLKYKHTFNYHKLGLDNTIVYQKVDGGDQIYNVPEITTRNTLYFQDKWFKKALFFQTGVTFKYFSKYSADGYDPLLAEFYVQNEEEIGGFSQFDIFFNAKIKQTRIFFKVENFGEAFSQNRQFSAPGYATRDAVLRFGLVWNFFM
ncbi:putative porin [Aquimarina hainanensis]|uniref:Porin n=1 Tax=Aquimarina hainanensis TaxID=1578017 RepID=A0ABW5N683_9FLAO